MQTQPVINRGVTEGHLFYAVREASWQILVQELQRHRCLHSHQTDAFPPKVEGARNRLVPGLMLLPLKRLPDVGWHTPTGNTRPCRGNLEPVCTRLSTQLSLTEWEGTTGTCSGKKKQNACITIKVKVKQGACRDCRSMWEHINTTSISVLPRSSIINKLGHAWWGTYVTLLYQ